jgi:hypothetical protein
MIPIITPRQAGYARRDRYTANHIKYRNRGNQLSLIHPTENPKQYDILPKRKHQILHYYIVLNVIKIAPFLIINTSRRSI